MVDFTAALGKKAAEVEKPKPKPGGMYRSVTVGMPKQKTIVVQGEEKGIISFTLRPLMAVTVEDQDALNAQPPVETWPPQTKDFWVMNGDAEDEQGMFNLTRFLEEHLGIEKKGKTLGQMCAESSGKQVLTEYENYPYTDKEGTMQIGTRIKSTAAV